jgi:hypothetical protein
MITPPPNPSNDDLHAESGRTWKYNASINAWEEITGITPAAIGAIASDPTGVTGATAISNSFPLTKAQYDAIETKNASTLYVIIP